MIGSFGLFQAACPIPSNLVAVAVFVSTGTCATPGEIFCPRFFQHTMLYLETSSGNRRWASFLSVVLSGSIVGFHVLFLKVELNTR